MPNFDQNTLFWGTAKNYGDWMRGECFEVGIGPPVWRSCASHNGWFPKTKPNVRLSEKSNRTGRVLIYPRRNDPLLRASNPHKFYEMEWILKMMKKRSELGLGSALFGISDPGLVKKTFFKAFFHRKLTRGPGDEISEDFCDTWAKVLSLIHI